MSAPDLATATAVLSVSLGELESLGHRFARAARAHKDALGRRDEDATKAELAIVGTLLAEARISYAQAQHQYSTARAHARMSGEVV
jgi:hypothetical protein